MFFLFAMVETALIGAKISKPCMTLLKYLLLGGVIKISLPHQHHLEMSYNILFQCSSIFYTAAASIKREVWN